MNKLIIFDLDGVLIDSRELHYDALNAALRKVGEEYVISRQEHLSLYDGLNTTRKLKMLTEYKGLPVSLYDKVWQDKQKSTFDLLRKFNPEFYLSAIFNMARNRGYKIAVASNSIRETVKLSLLSIELMDYVDYFVSNEDVSRPKPYPEMYWKCMTALNALPKDTIIVEDSHIGRQGALDSGAHLLAVENSNEVNSQYMMERISNFMDSIEGKTKKSLPWRDNKLNVIIPMAGAGSRFSQAGYTFPKPLIEVRGKPMIQVVIENLNVEANYIFLVQKEHYDKYNLKYLLNLIAPNCKIVLVDGLTEGSACTTLLAKEYIDNALNLGEQFLAQL